MHSLSNRVSTQIERSLSRRWGTLLFWFFFWVGGGCQPSYQPSTRADSPSLNPRSLIDEVARRCEESGPNIKCASWGPFYATMIEDQRSFEVGYPQTQARVKLWLTASLDALSQANRPQRVVGLRVLDILFNRLRYHEIPHEDDVFKRLYALLTQETDPLWTTKLLSLVGAHLPLGQGLVLRRFTEHTEPLEVRNEAWRVLTRRASPEEPLSKEAILKAMKVETEPLVRGGLILAGAVLKIPQTVKWCEGDWWRGEIFAPCKKALTMLATFSASKKLALWIRALYDEGEQTLNYDLTLAQSLATLIPGMSDRRVQSLAQKLLDHFFSKRRTEVANFYLVRALRGAPSRSFALKLALRYYTLKSPELVEQSHLSNQKLRSLIHRLGGELAP